MRFGILGPLEATAESGGPVAPRSARARALLAVLLRRFVMGSPVTKTRALVARVLGLAALAATVAACGDDDAAARGDGYRYSAEIRRTEYGIPHIVARDYDSLGYGYGYAFAQDNLCVMAERVLTLRGERSRYFGPTADANDPLADERGISNLASDVYYRGVRRSGVVRRLLARQAPLGPTAQLRRMVDGYVADYNRYLRDTGVAQRLAKLRRLDRRMATRVLPHRPTRVARHTPASARLRS